ncbi:uncharacterized protein LOC116413583 [Galleria mellonella]|uniref:Uncharacterized protein LOC116413583 n=1 Tax=Galleria mellonella TaxID=7137 RepID=A0A6J3CEB5_GALME|nr:uncharacterized protein LOC116413583 [Galleria mellonella]
MFWFVVLATAAALCAGEPEVEQVAAPSGAYGLREPTVGIPDLSRGHRIIESVNLPDYHEPTLLLDYRYLKTGGRDYTRGPGGQYLILPRNVHTQEPKEFRNYDELLEALSRRNRARVELQRQYIRDNQRNWEYSAPRGHSHLHGVH